MHTNHPKQNTEHPSEVNTRSAGGGLLLVVAAETEARAIRAAFGVRGPDPVPSVFVLESLSDGVDLIVTGVGKAQAAAGTAWAYDPGRHRGTLSIGVGGVLPSRNDLPESPDIGGRVLATLSVFGDEGVRTTGGFTPIADLGFPPGSPDGGFGSGEGGGMPCSPEWRAALESVSDHAGIIATVSACSGTDGSARDIAERTGAIAENMEGAAVAAALSRLPVTAGPRPRYAEIRVISNTTGDRATQVWDLATALDRLGEAAVEAVRAIRSAET